MAARRRTLHVMANSQWLPYAVRVPGNSAGPMAGGGAKTLHHTSEGSTAASCISAVRAKNAWPHFTSEWTGARLAIFQHIPYNMGARALQHPSGPETNRANCVQIEHVGFTDDRYREQVGADPMLHVSRWPDARWAAIGAMCRDIEAATGCPAVSAVPLDWWPAPNGRRQSGQGFYGSDGHTAHVFCPGNSHLDGTGFKIGLVLNVDDKPHRNLRVGTVTSPTGGDDVMALQLAVRLHASRCGRQDHMPVADGFYGLKTRDDAAFVAYVLGIGHDQASIVAGGLSAAVQGWIREPKTRNRTQLKRAAVRRPKHCKGATS